MDIPENLPAALREAANWIARRPNAPMTPAGRAAAILVAAETLHPHNPQAARTYMEQLGPHMPAVENGTVRADYANTLLDLAWRV